MPRFRVLVAYDGGAFHGWQIQRSVRTVEGELTNALETISSVRSKVQGASRTDAGVHALGQVAHFDYEGRMDAHQLLCGLNALSDGDVRVVRCERVADDFHARYHAQGKLYRYRVWNHPVHHPLHRRDSYWIKRPLDLDAMRGAAVGFEGTHDFSALRAASCDAFSPRLTLFEVQVLGESPNVVIEVRGAAFLKYMVRTLVGTLLTVGLGKRDADSIGDLLAARDRTVAGKTASAHGLRLVQVYYPSHPWQAGEIAASSGL